MRATVFVGTSVDGFIARPNGENSTSSQPAAARSTGNEFFASVDAGHQPGHLRDVLRFGSWPYGRSRSWC
jgi:hypothetical protein